MLWTSQGVRSATGFLMLTALRLQAARILRQPHGVASSSRTCPGSTTRTTTPSGFAWQSRGPQTTRSAARRRPGGDGATEVATMVRVPHHALWIYGVRAGSELDPLIFSIWFPIKILLKVDAFPSHHRRRAMSRRTQEVIRPRQRLKIPRQRLKK